MDSIGVIGGADGPAAVFVTSSPNRINVFGIAIAALLLIPDIILALRRRSPLPPCKSRAVKLTESILHVFSMLLMIFHIGPGEFGFPSVGGFLIYIFGGGLLTLLYLGLSIAQNIKPGRGRALILTAVPPVIFVLCGAALRYWPLAAFGALTGAARAYMASRPT